MSSSKNPLTYVYSDVHLGVDKIATRYFNNELKRIIKNQNNKQVFIQNLILNGDTWDRLIRMDDFFDKQNTKMLLKKITSQGTRIIPILGNHELSVSGEYDNEFSKRKNAFFKGYNWNFIDNSSITQYVILIKKKDDFTLNTYDSVDDIDPSIFTNSDRNTNYIICHGFQFQNNLELLARFWNFCLNGNRVRKTGCKKIWYNLVGGRWIRKTGEDLDDRIVDNIEEIDIDFIEIQDAYNEYTRNEAYFERLIEFCRINNLLNHIGNVVFGHTHAPANGERIGVNENLMVYNTGSWIEYNDYFHLLEIDMLNGKANLLRSNKIYLRKNNFGHK